MRATTIRTMILGLCTTLSVNGFAAVLRRDAGASIPRDVQQLIVLDNRAMQNSVAARGLEEQALPPELANLRKALLTCGLNVDEEVDLLTFAVFRVGTGTRTVGIAQGQFQPALVQKKMRRNKVKLSGVRN